MAFKFIEHEDRICDTCSRNFLSGLIHVDRGSIVAMICYDCARPSDDINRLKRLSKAKWEMQRRGLED